MKKFTSFCLILFLLISVLVNAQSNFYDLNTIQEIHITFNQANWDYQMDTAKAGSEGYILAAQVVVNGVAFDSVGVKYKGNSSYSANRAKNPLHINLDYVHDNASYQGYTDFKLGNGYTDPSMIREVLSYKIARKYMHAPLCNFARVYINGNYHGIYSNSESINKDFCSNHFYSSDNTLVKCNPVQVGGTNLPNISYLGNDSTLYYNKYEMKSDYGWKDLINLADSLANHPTNIHTSLDVDRALWMLAFNNVLVNLDSYTGSFAQNYYLYKDDNARFNCILWDLNMSFGSFTMTGNGLPLSLTGLQQMSPMLHSTNTARPLIKQLLANSQYSKMYIAHMRTLNNQNFFNGTYQADAVALMALIDSSVQADPHYLYSYTQFQNSLTSNLTGGMGAPGIVNLMGPRATYLNNTTQFQQVPPTISNVVSGPAAVALNDTVWVTCSITNATNVLLGNRDNRSKIFNKTTMFDDGLHHDNVAGDGIFGGSFIATSAKHEYYVYAENNVAGMFSPERAEYEFYEININITTATIGQVVLNEFLAVNQNDNVDEAGAHEDWIELYNPSATPVSLFGLYLTDDANNKTKFAFPESAIIQPYSYLTIWADGDTSALSVHCNFKLASGGEEILLSDAAGNIFDSISFGPQLPDVSMGRCANGTGPFATTLATTFNAANSCPTAIAETQTVALNVFAFPNPASELVTFATNDNKTVLAELFNLNGQLIATAAFDNDKAQFKVNELTNGIYLYHAKDLNGTVLHSGKIVVAH